ncbi:MAG: fibronectin type III domain-containing protein [Flavobacteriales bacterium]|nr:fibronectin type III domain-containing protein [Flavobacteriales bacterium]
MRRAFLLHLLITLVLCACGQSSTNSSAVRLMATVQPTVPSITLQWQVYSNTSGFTLYRRSAGATTWGSALTTLPGTALQYVDTEVAIGQAVEYKLVRNADGSGYGYVRSGIAVPEVEMRGQLVLLVESGVAASLTNELAQLEADLSGDGWIVLRHDVSASASPSSVRSLVIADYTAAPAQVKSVYIIGHVPVPYSGNSSADGHSYHQGAWTCDGYYGEMNGNWTDANVNALGSNWAWNHNVPGDGKLDQNDFPTSVELQVGRVDLSRLDTFPESEVQLLSAYLNKAHAWKTGAFAVPAKAAVWDNLEWLSNPIGASGYLSATPCVGIDSVVQLESAQAQFSQHFLNNDDLFTYHCSTGLQGADPSIAAFPGTENGLNIGQLVSNVHGGVFNMSLGSYYGDWDNKNNFLRAVLARGNALAHVWSGMPNWFLHPMAMGEPIGYCALRTMNNANSDYSLMNGGWQGQSMGQAHMALMGDPSVRMRYVRPPTELVATNDQWFATFAWSASPEQVDGYHVYHIDDANSTITRLNSSPIVGTQYTTTALFVPGGRYMVRAVKLVTTPSGSYHDLSLGAIAIGEGTQIADCQGVIGGPAIPGAPCDDGDPLTNNDVYSAECSCSGLAIGIDEPVNNGFRVWPSPTNDVIHVVAKQQEGELVLRTLAGAEVSRMRVIGGSAGLDVRDLASGTYLVEYRAYGELAAIVRRVVVHH